ncbi:MAG: hypothetical protein ACTHOE_12055 [Conexibacter sp.]
MAAVTAAMAGLDEAAATRVLRWATDRFAAPELLVPAAGSTLPDQQAAERSFESIFVLFEAAEVNSDADRAILAGYWFQVLDGAPSFGGGQVNDALRQMGVGIGNIAQLLNRLIARKPALVQQVSKSGRSAQARKQYRLTTAGITAARDLLAGGESGQGT